MSWHQNLFGEECQVTGLKKQKKQREAQGHKGEKYTQALVSALSCVYFSPLCPYVSRCFSP